MGKGHLLAFFVHQPPHPPPKESCHTHEWVQPNDVCVCVHVCVCVCGGVGGGDKSMC